MTAALATIFLINTALKHQRAEDEIAQHEELYSSTDSIMSMFALKQENRAKKALKKKTSGNL